MSEALPSDDECAKGTRDWPHAPPHRLAAAGVYFVTARTSEKRHLFRTPALLDWFMRLLFDITEQRGWRLEAWAVLSNHYHIVAHSPDGDAKSLGPMLQKLHSVATKEMNRLDGTPGRTRLWQNFRDTHLTYQRSYLARLSYVHQNAVHHRLVRDAAEWRWCSAGAIENEATEAWVKTIWSFRYDEIAKEDGE